MATFRRALTPGATYFFTVNTYQRQRVLTDDPFFLALKQSIRRVRETHPFKIEALALLPDHLHCIWTLPGNDADYAVRWSLIKRLASQQTRDLIRPEVSKSRKKRREIERMRGQVLYCYICSQSKGVGECRRVKVSETFESDSHQVN